MKGETRSWCKKKKRRDEKGCKESRGEERKEQSRK